MAAQFGSINYLAVLIAAIVYYALGTLWYSAFFGKIWQRYVPMTKEDVKNANKAMTIMGVISLISAFVFAIILLYSTSLSSDLLLGLLIGILYALIDYSSVNFEKRPSTIYWINVSYNIIGFILMALVFGLFR